MCSCLRYCKSTSFQANHNMSEHMPLYLHVVCDTAKVRVFKQITTCLSICLFIFSCLRYCKSTSFQANHNGQSRVCVLLWVVCDTAKVRVFKQITTNSSLLILLYCCLRYCKSTSFQANHNYLDKTFAKLVVVCDTAKVRVFKQITTGFQFFNFRQVLFAILQKYEFSSKSQHTDSSTTATACCLRYCKSTSFQANHNFDNEVIAREIVVCDTAKVRVFKQITTA